VKPDLRKKLSEFAKNHSAQAGLFCIPEAREVAGAENESFNKWINGI